MCDPRSGTSRRADAVALLSAGGPRYAYCPAVQGGLAPPAERFVQVLQVVLDALALALQERLHRVGESRMRQPVRAGGLHRHQRARHLVLALRAAFEALDSRWSMHHCSGW